jgi:hypothetical protein
VSPREVRATASVTGPGRANGSAVGTAGSPAAGGGTGAAAVVCPQPVASTSVSSAAAPAIVLVPITRRPRRTTSG